MREEARKEVCEALQAIEEQYFLRLFAAYEQLREEEFWDAVESLNGLVDLVNKICR